MVIFPGRNEVLKDAVLQGLGRAGMLWCGSGYVSIGEITAP